MGVLGMKWLQWLAKNALKKPKFALYVHSLNFPGATNIISELGYGSHIPFVWTKLISF